MQEIGFLLGQRHHCAISGQNAINRVEKDHGSPIKMVVGASGCQPFNACFTALAARARYGVLIAPEEWNNSPTTSLAIAKQLSPSLFVWDKQRQPEQIHVLLPWLVKYQPDKEDPEDYAHRHAEHHAPSESIRFVAVKRP